MATKIVKECDLCGAAHHVKRTWFEDDPQYVIPKGWKTAVLKGGSYLMCTGCHNELLKRLEGLI